MEEDTKHIQSIQNLEIQYLKSEKESLIRSNHVYSEKISEMEVEISELKAMLQACQNENQSFCVKISRLQEELLMARERPLEHSRDNTETSPISKNLQKNDDIDDLFEEVSELREENLYFKGQYIPKLENQLDHARMLIKELENEVDCLNREKEMMKESFCESRQNESMKSLKNNYQEVLDSLEKNNGLKTRQKNFKGKNNRNYVPSIKRIDKPVNGPEYMINLSKR